MEKIVSDNSGYYQRNRLWIDPVIAGFILTVAPMLVATIAEPEPSPIPSWISTVGLLIAGFVGGIGAIKTDTASAYIIRYLANALGVIVGFHALFMLFMRS